MTQDIVVATGSDGLATVTLNRPGKRNAITLAMWRELARIFTELGQSTAARAIVLTGAGGNFSAGADISEFATVRESKASGSVYEQAAEAALHAVVDCSKPTIAQIAGFAIGGACALSCACDFRIADQTASFFIPASRLGVVYSRFETELVLQQVGLANAKFIILSGERIPAQQAADLGLVNKLAHGDVGETVSRFIAPFLAAAPISLAGNKFILNTLARGQADERKAEVEGWIHHSMDSEDYKEGQRAFREKRPPVFSGR